MPFKEAGGRNTLAHTDAETPQAVTHGGVGGLGWNHGQIWALQIAFAKFVFSVDRVFNAFLHLFFFDFALFFLNFVPSRTAHTSFPRLPSAASGVGMG